MAPDAGARALALTGFLLRVTGYALLVAPPLIVIGSSFTAGNSLRFPPQGLSLRWYRAAFADAEFTGALVNSLLLALFTMAISTAIALAAAYALDRHRFPGSRAVAALVMAPLAVPAVSLGLALLILLAGLGLHGTLLGLLVAHVVVTLPYGVRTLLAAFALFDRRLEDAAASLRAGPARTLWRVTLPVLLPGIVSAMMLVFVISFGNVIISMLVAGSGFVTLPVQILTYVEAAYDPVISAVSTLVIVITAVVLLIAEVLFGTEHRG